MEKRELLEMFFIKWKETSGSRAEEGRLPLERNSEPLFVPTGVQAEMQAGG